MAWIDIKRKDEPHIYYVPSQAYEDIYKAQGFIVVENEIAENAKNNASTAQSAEVDKSIKPTPKTPVKRQYTRHAANGDK